MKVIINHMAYSPDTDPGIIVSKRWYDSLPRKSWQRFEKVETSQPWFEVYETTPETYAIYEPYQFEEVISYLVLGEDRAALIDTGNGIGDIKALTEELTDLDTIVVNTHSHSDHTGGNWAFENVFLYDTPFSRDRLRGRTHEELGNFIGDGMVWKQLTPGIDPEKFQVKGFNVRRWLRNGDRIDLGGKELEVIHTPGHTPCSISILEGKERLLFTGDMYYPAPIYVYALGTNLEDFIASFRKMTSTPFYHNAMPGHNETLMPKSEIDAVLKAAESIKAGFGGTYKSGVANGIKVKRYDFAKFALIVRE